MVHEDTTKEGESSQLGMFARGENGTVGESSQEKGNTQTTDWSKKGKHKTTNRFKGIMVNYL